ncbi:MAG: hypothetical protein WA021_03470, partial [Minisyncoccia bacterium]
GESARNVKYLNYSRNLRAPKFTVEERRQYLKDRGITDVHDLVFIDTGYQGSIPEHILHDIFGMNDYAEIDKRVLLLETGIASRQIRKSPGANSGSVGMIEMSPMLTQSAVGLYSNPKSGKLAAYAQPNTPETILAHEAIKYLVMRHFYLQGRSERNKSLLD